MRAKARTAGRQAPLAGIGRIGGSPRSPTAEIMTATAEASGRSDPSNRLSSLSISCGQRLMSTVFPPQAFAAWPVTGESVSVPRSSQVSPVPLAKPAGTKRTLIPTLRSVTAQASCARRSAGARRRRSGRSPPNSAFVTRP